MPAVDKENQGPPGTAVFTVGGKPAKSSSPRAVWNTATVQNLLDTLKQQKADGNQTDNASWKVEAFNAASINLAECAVRAGSRRRLSNYPKNTLNNIS
ncbi:hypothetical protein B0H19DRAFT_1253903 [Mycena capillaripes]|nr:hypothetical protein B0H19DRAFT_1253903 [Mycena capillaripes]